MAAAYGQITGLPGACLSTLGRGRQFVNAVASAKLDRTPMIALSGQIDGTREHTFTHQVLNHDAMFASVSKWTAPIRRDTVSTVMGLTAVAERPGPVHISTGADVVGAGNGQRNPPTATWPSGRRVRSFRQRGWTGAERPAEKRRPSGDCRWYRGGAGGCGLCAGPSRRIRLSCHRCADGERHPAGRSSLLCRHAGYGLQSTDMGFSFGYRPDTRDRVRRGGTDQTVDPKCPVVHIDSTPNTDQTCPTSNW